MLITPYFFSYVANFCGVYIGSTYTSDTATLGIWMNSGESGYIGDAYISDSIIVI